MMLTEKECDEISKKWFFLHECDESEFDGISMGKILQLKIFEKLYTKAQVGDEGFSLKEIIKRLELEWVLRSVLSFFSNDRDKVQRDYLFIYDVNSGPMIKALNVLSSKLSGRGESVGAITIDGDISKKCSINNKLSWFCCFSITDFYRFISKAFQYAFFIRKLKRVYQELGFSVGKDKAKLVEKYFRFQSFLLLLEKLAIESLLIKKMPKVIVVASDAHRVSRMTILLAKKYNMKTIVYQHGATIWDYGYIPVYADKIMVWGSSSKKWFIDRGVKPDKIVITGNVLMDTYVSKKNEMIKGANKKIFFFPNPIDRDITKSVIKEVDLVCKINSVSGYLKLHPSEKNIDFFNFESTKSMSNLKVSTDSIKNLDINIGDIAVIINSTAGIDACLYGAIVFCIDVPGIPNSVNYEEGGVGIHSKIETFSKDFHRVLNFSIKNYNDSRPFFLKSEIGNLDGLALHRAVDFLVGYK